MKGKIDSSTTIVGNINTSLSIMDRTSRQKIYKEIKDLNNIIDELYLTNIYKFLWPTTAEYTFFINVHGLFSRIEHTLSHNMSQ